MLRFFVKLYSTIEPDEELLIGPFLGRRVREHWLEHELPASLKALRQELGLGQLGARAERRSFIRQEPAAGIVPDDLINVIRRQYRDIYATY